MSCGSSSLNCCRGPRGPAGPPGPCGECDCLTVVTLDEAKALMAVSGLRPGCYYQVNGCCVENLYDDGTHSGTSIIFQSQSASLLPAFGKGQFWVPKYPEGQNTGNGIWNGTLMYAIGDKTIWGGYSWTNLTGNVGGSLDDYRLDPVNWAKNVFGAVNYNFVVHAVEYDWQFDIINSRRDDVNNVLIRFASRDMQDGNIYGPPILDFQWGNNWNAYYYCGIGNVIVDGSSYMKTINSRASFFFNITLTNNSVMAPIRNPMFGLEVQNVTCNNQSQLIFKTVDESSAGTTELRVEFSTFDDNCLFQFVGGLKTQQIKPIFRRCWLKNFYATLTNFVDGIIESANFQDVPYTPDYNAPTIDVATSGILKNTRYTKWIYNDAGYPLNSNNPNPMMYRIENGIMIFSAANA